MWIEPNLSSPLNTATNFLVGTCRAQTHFLPEEEVSLYSWFTVWQLILNQSKISKFCEIQETQGVIDIQDLQFQPATQPNATHAKV